jgi:hypothetical protein
MLWVLITRVDNGLPEHVISMDDNVFGARLDRKYQYRNQVL